MVAAGLVAKKAVERGLEREAVGEDLAHAGLDGGQPVSRCDRPAALSRHARLRRRRLQLRARASARRARSTRRSRKSIIDKRRRRVRGALGQPQFRGAHPSGGARGVPREPAARRRVRARGARRYRSRRASRSVATRRRSRCICSDIWPTAGGACSSALEHRGESRVLSRALSADIATRESAVERRSRRRPARCIRGKRDSSYIKEPPFLDEALTEIDAARHHGRARARDPRQFDHHRPHQPDRQHQERRSPAGSYLQRLGVAPADFNNYGARRMNHEVMVRGTFANVRLQNLMVPGVEGGVTVHQPSGEQMSIYDAAMRYAAERVPLVVVAGEEYGTGSARDWAAKGTRLLGVRAVIADSFERIHRSNLVGMGVLPCQLPAGTHGGDARARRQRDVRPRRARRRREAAAGADAGRASRERRDAQRCR